MIRENEEERLTFSWPFHLLGPLLVLLAIAFPVLIVTQDQQPLTSEIFSMAGAMVLVGIFCSVYMARYAILLRADGFTLKTVFSTKDVLWRDVVQVGFDDRGKVTIAIFTLASGRKVKVPFSLPRVERLLQEAAERLPPVVWPEREFSNQ